MARQDSISRPMIILPLFLKTFIFLMGYRNANSFTFFQEIVLLSVYQIYLNFIPRYSIMRSHIAYELYFYDLPDQRDNSSTQYQVSGNCKTLFSLNGWIVSFFFCPFLSPRQAFLSYSCKTKHVCLCIPRNTQKWLQIFLIANVFLVHCYSTKKNVMIHLTCTHTT